MFTKLYVRCVEVVAMAALLLSAPLLMAGTLTALTESLPPLNYEVDGRVTGFSSELLDMMAKEAGLTLNKQVLPWPRAYDMAIRLPDTLVYSTVRTAEREALFQWVGPISSRRILLYKHRDRTDISLKTLDDARAYRIGTTHDSAATRNLLKQGFQINDPRAPKAPGLDIAQHDEMNMKKFVARRFDLLLSLDWAEAYNARNARVDPDEIQPAWVLDDSLSYWYAVNLGTDPEVARKLNAALAKLRDDGRYLELKRKYLPKVTE